MRQTPGFQICALHHFILTKKMFSIKIRFKIQSEYLSQGNLGSIHLGIIIIFFWEDQIMEMQKMGKQLINFQKSLFENSYHAMNMVFEQTENMVNSFLKQMPMVPEESKKAMDDVLVFYKKSRDDFKKAVDDGFTKMEEIFIPKEK
jgi:polyhydroxyalkanoate synthesis regulator phasin